MRFVWELVAVFVAGLVVFVMMIGGMVAWLVMGVIGLASAVFFGMGLFCAVGFLFFHTAHNLLTTAVYFGYSAIAFAVLVVLHYIPGRARDIIGARAERRSLDRIGGLQIAADAPFHVGRRRVQRL